MSAKSVGYDREEYIDRYLVDECGFERPKAEEIADEMEKAHGSDVWPVNIIEKDS